jgi:hypothetical protein
MIIIRQALDQEVKLTCTTKIMCGLQPQMGYTEDNIA